MENEVYAVSIELMNVKCVPGAELRLGRKRPGEGRLIVVKGDNGAGKSAILEGIKAVVEGGSNPQLISDGKPKFEVRMSLSDGTEIKLVQTRKTYRLDIVTPESDVPIKAPATFVKKMFGSGVSFDPISFCTLKKEERLKYLSSVMPLDFTEAEIAAAMGASRVLLTPPAGTLDVIAINRLQNDLKEKRGAVGSKRDEKADSVESWRKLLLNSASDGVDWKVKLAGLETQRTAIEKDRDAEVSLIEGQIQTVRTGLNAKIRKAEDSARDRFTHLLEIVRSGEDKISINALSDDLVAVATHSAALNTAEYDAQSALDKTRADAGTKLEALSAEIATAKTGFESQAKDVGIRSEMEKFRKEVQKLSADWDAIAEAITNLGLLRLSKLKSLIDGFDIREDGEILVNGREFDSLNTGAQYMQAMIVGSIGAGESGVLVADDTVHLGPPQWELFKEAVLASPLTVIATRLLTDEEIKQFGPGLRSEPAEALVLQ